MSDSNTSTRIEPDTQQLVGSGEPEDDPEVNVVQQQQQQQQQQPQSRWKRHKWGIIVGTAILLILIAHAVAIKLIYFPTFTCNKANNCVPVKVKDVQCSPLKPRFVESRGNTTYKVGLSAN